MRILVLVIACGCGRVGFDARGDGGGGGGDDGITIQRDAPCASFGPWQPPVAISELNTVSDESGAQISGDGLSIFFNSNRSGTDAEDLYQATRSSRADPFSAVLLGAPFSSSSDDIDPTFTTDLLDFEFTSDRGGGECFYDATRPDAMSSAWTAVEQVSLCSEVFGPYLTPDGLTLYYNTQLDPAFEGDVKVTTRASRSDPFFAGTSLGFSVGANTGYAALSGDGLTIYFEAETALGADTELWQATRPTLVAPFASPIRVAGVGLGAGNETDVSITADGTELFFASDAGNTPNVFDLYVSTRACL